MSPTGPKESGLTPGSIKGRSASQKTKLSSTPRKARRPSSLQYCLKLNPPKRTVRPEAQELSIVPEAQPVAGSPRKLVAPKATPEDSLIGSCCSSTSEEQPILPGFTEDLTRSPEILGESSDASGWESRLRLTAAQDSTLPGDWATSSVMPECHSFHEVPRNFSVPHFERDSTEFAKAEESNEDCSEQGANPMDGTNLMTKLSAADSPLTRQFRLLNLSQQSSKQHPWELTLRRCSGSGNSLSGEERLRHASIGDTRDLKESSTVSLYPTSQPSETNTLIADSSSPKRSQTLSISDGSSDCRMHATAASATTTTQPVVSYQSPVSPSCQWSHSRFSHIGSHALDVFFSPEEATSPTEPLWRPVATTMRGSPTERNSSSSSDPFEGDVAGYAQADENPSSVLAPLLTSLDVFVDDDDLEDCGNVTVKHATELSPTRTPLKPRVLCQPQDVTQKIKSPVETSERCGMSVVSLKSRSLEHSPGGSSNFPSEGIADYSVEGSGDQELGSSVDGGGSADHPVAVSVHHLTGSGPFDRSCMEELKTRRCHSVSSQQGSDHQSSHSGDRRCTIGNCPATLRPTADIPDRSNNGNWACFLW